MKKAMLIIVILSSMVFFCASNPGIEDAIELRIYASGGKFSGYLIRVNGDSIETTINEIGGV